MQSIDASEIQGAIVGDQILSSNWEGRKSKFAGHFPNSILEDALAKFRVLLSADVGRRLEAHLNELGSDD